MNITITSADVTNVFSDQWVAEASWEATTGPYEAEVYQGTYRIKVYGETGITDTNTWQSSPFQEVGATDTDSFEIQITDANGNTGSTVVDTSTQ